MGRVPLCLRRPPPPAVPRTLCRRPQALAPAPPPRPAVPALRRAGRALADLHVGYESAPEHDLRLVHDPDQPLTYRVEKMRWADADKTALRLNDAITLENIPPEAHAYTLGNRSALDWLVDQLRVKTDKRSGIVHLIQRVTHVSVETVRIVEALPGLGLPQE